MLAAPDNLFSCFVQQSSTPGADFADTLALCGVFRVAVLRLTGSWREYGGACRKIQERSQMLIFALALVARIA
nr:hypothetical protein [Brucella intermedia]